MSVKYRTEQDSLGQVKVPENALYGAQTQRALDNFPVSGLRMPRSFIRALGLVKACAAITNGKLDKLDSDMAEVISRVALQVANGEYDEAFPVDVFQTGSGTSSNMNANEVIARLSSQQLSRPVHPNDHVNLAQSSNDVIPSAINISLVLQLQEGLFPALRKLQQCLDKRAADTGMVIKTGRTHLMDGMPLTLAQELSGWSSQLGHCRDSLTETLPRLYQLAQGGTAVGTGVNAPPEFAVLFAKTLAEKTGFAFVPNANFFDALSFQGSSVELSGKLKVLAVALMKIANDLRWMNSGPIAGLAEIELQPLQPGSSIMPGKVNPVIAESAAMVAAQVIGNDSVVTVAGQSGNFQLNTMLPVIAWNLLQSVELLGNTCQLLADKAISTFKIRQKNMESNIHHNPILATALSPIVGYEKAAEIAKRAYAEQRSVIEVAEVMTDLSRQELESLLDPSKLV